MPALRLAAVRIVITIQKCQVSLRNTLKLAHRVILAIVRMVGCQQKDLIM